MVSRFEYVQYKPKIKENIKNKTKIYCRFSFRFVMIVGSCSSPQLSMCRGVLPWDLTATPIIPGISSPPDLDAIMPYFEMISSTGCSARIRQFLCSLLEPECRGVGYNILPPCRKACRGKVSKINFVAII